MGQLVIPVIQSRIGNIQITRHGNKHDLFVHRINLRQDVHICSCIRGQGIITGIRTGNVDAEGMACRSLLGNIRRACLFRHFNLQAVQQNRIIQECGIRIGLGNGIGIGRIQHKHITLARIQVRHGIPDRILLICLHLGVKIVVQPVHGLALVVLVHTALGDECPGSVALQVV